MPQTLTIQTSEPKARWQPSKMSWWYHSILDFMMANPQATKKEMAAYFHCSEVAINLITNSDIFRAHFAARREQFAEILDASIHQKLATIADKSLGILSEVLDKKRESIPLMQLVEIQDKVLDRLGYGLEKKPVATPAPSVSVFTGPVQQNTSVTVPVSPSDLEAARRALRRSEELKMIESQPLKSGEREAQLFEGRLGSDQPSPALDGPNGSEGPAEDADGSPS
jgi:hypothetical protein